MKKFVKLVAAVLVMASVFSIMCIPASAVTNGEWDTGYSIIKSNGKATSADSFHIYSSAGFVARKVYIKSVCGAMRGLDEEIDEFYKDITFTVKIYTTNGKLKETETVKIGEYFTMPRTAIKCNYKVVITKNVPKNLPRDVLNNHNFLCYMISTKK